MRRGACRPPSFRLLLHHSRGRASLNPFVANCSITPCNCAAGRLIRAGAHAQAIPSITCSPQALCRFSTPRMLSPTCAQRTRMRSLSKPGSVGAICRRRQAADAPTPPRMPGSRPSWRRAARGTNPTPAPTTAENRKRADSERVPTEPARLRARKRRARPSSQPQPPAAAALANVGPAARPPASPLPSAQPPSYPVGDHHPGPVACDISRFSPRLRVDLTGFFPGKHFLHFLVQGFSEFRST